MKPYLDVFLLHLSYMHDCIIILNQRCMCIAADISDYRRVLNYRAQSDIGIFENGIQHDKHKIYVLLFTINMLYAEVSVLHLASHLVKTSPPNGLKYEAAALLTWLKIVIISWLTCKIYTFWNTSLTNISKFESILWKIYFNGLLCRCWQSTDKFDRIDILWSSLSGAPDVC